MCYRGSLGIFATRCPREQPTCHRPRADARVLLARKIGCHGDSGAILLPHSLALVSCSIRTAVFAASRLAKSTFALRAPTLEWLTALAFQVAHLAPGQASATACANLGGPLDTDRACHGTPSWLQVRLPQALILKRLHAALQPHLGTRLRDKPDDLLVDPAKAPSSRNKRHNTCDWRARSSARNFFPATSVLTARESLSGAM